VGNRAQVLTWLSQVKSADIWKTESGVWAMNCLPHWVKKRLMKILQEIDPEGYREMMALKISLGLRKYHDKKIPFNEAVAKFGLMVAEQEYLSEGLTVFRFVQGTELLDIIASMRAAGYSVKEINTKTNISIEIINRVTSEQIARMKRNFNDAIVNAADQKVYHDIMADEISQNTVRADQIAQRRRKLDVDAAKAIGSLAGKGKGPLPSTLEAMKKKISDRFKVEKDITGEVYEEKTDDQEAV